MKTVIIVHGIGGGNTATKIGYSNDLKKNVLSDIEVANCQKCWQEASWEGINDTLDAKIVEISRQLIPDRPTPKKVDYPNTTSGYIRFVWQLLCCCFSKLARAFVPATLDYLLDLPLYVGEPRGSKIRDTIIKTIKENPNCVLVGHSLGSLICYDILCEAKTKGLDLHVKALVTLGSPIGWAKDIDEQEFITIKPMPLSIPWVNIYYVSDPVCLSKPLDGKRFVGVENIELKPPSSIGLIAHTGYWKDTVVAKKIRELADISI
jgi:hypothetical protein